MGEPFKVKKKPGESRVIAATRKMVKILPPD
jgi:hypothetical protein